MNQIKWMSGENIPLEMHKVRIIEKLNLLPIEERKEAIERAGHNSFLLQNREVFLDMLTDSGVNAMSDLQLAAMMRADDSYAGSETFNRLQGTLQDIFGLKHFLPAHQGRACEHIIAKVFVKQGDIIPMNFHFTTTKAHIVLMGGEVVELLTEEGLKVNSDCQFKGNMDVEALEKLILDKGRERIPFVRMEAGTNLIGGQPFSLQNLRDVKEVCLRHDLLLVLDASLLSDNLYFMKVREEELKNTSLHDIMKMIGELCDIIYFSARKLGSAKGGGILTNHESFLPEMKELVTLYEGFLTYGGMSVREMEAINVGLRETLDFDFISQAPEFIRFMVDEFLKEGVPVVTPAGGLGCHLNAKAFLPHVEPTEYPAGALSSALYLISGIRGMERGTLSEQRNEDGSEEISSMELLRLALPRRVFTLSQIKYVIDRVTWLHENRELIGGLKFVEEPKTLRFFFGRLEPIGDWQDNLLKKFKEDFGESL
ncbi:MAG: tryptophanase [Clostridium sp.]|nr:tryptophanase [Clostridium sp.]